MTSQSVTFESGGETIAGRLFPAAFGDRPAPAVTILGPTTFVKEQSPAQYAERLARLGFTVLTFDPRFRGESGGEPRCYESPAAKVQDARAAQERYEATGDVEYVPAVVHSDGCALPDAARRHFAVVPTADKRLLWQDGTRHLQYYDDPAVIDGAVWAVGDWLSTHLGAPR
jgi:fermentation-respiration switch protein FrsA (DUF1100 family)